MSRARQLIENEWRTVKLQDILTDEQLRVVTEILNRPGDDIDKVPVLKAHLDQYEKELESKGVLPEFLAYWIAAHAPLLRRHISSLN